LEPGRAAETDLKMSVVGRWVAVGWGAACVSADMKWQLA
jgi:hypothetical protein